jgi:hypothetical protein
MIEIFKKIFSNKKDSSRGGFLGTLGYKGDNLICGIGESKICDTEIEILKYPFKPSVVYFNNKIKVDQISAICFDAYPPLIRIENEVIIVSRENADALKKFAERNNIQLFVETRNWNWILEPYVDTEYMAEDDRRISELLNENGISKSEIDQIRDEVGKQMYKYNFGTMLWDWCSLGLQDVLSAMNAKYNENEFADFYKRAMEIELRKATINTQTCV